MPFGIEELTMKCEDVIEDLQTGAVPLGAALEHLAECQHCQAARRAIVALEIERAQPVPRLAEGAFERALQRAVQPQPRAAAGGRGFWLGTVVGGALAASVAIAVTLWSVQPQSTSAPPAANPQVRLALHEVHAVNVSLESPMELMGAEIHVVLTGAVGLQGFPDQRELRWTTDLDRGMNQLTLPLVALGPSGGQVMVEVRHGDKRRAFVVDVQTTDDAARRRAEIDVRPLAV
jgi:hypothetical protein